MSQVLFPRFQLAEIEDQSWCPEWLREHSHKTLARMWGTRIGGAKSPAEQACDILVSTTGGLGSAQKYDFIDSCAGAGGPTPLMEASLNQSLTSSGYSPVRFVLTDLWPDLKAWKQIRSARIDRIETPVDATAASRIAHSGKRECRIFNLCFHHFDDGAARKVLSNAVKTADAFVIFEMTHRTLPSLLNTAIVILAPFFTTLVDYWWSPWHLFFTYLVPCVLLFYMVDGFVSCARTRTAGETWALLDKNETQGWEFKSGQKVVLPPFGILYWYSGVRTDPDVKANGRV